MTDIDDEAAADAPANTGRRDLLTKGAVAAAVAAVAGVAVARPASAANGDTMRIGDATMTGTSVTRLSGSTFQVVNGSSDVPQIGIPALYGRGTQLNGIGVLGEAVGTGTKHGVYGRSTGTFGIGVYGESTGTGGNGVWGYTNTTGAGVYGQNDGTSGGAGVVGDSTNGPDFAAVGSGVVSIQSSGVSNPPGSGGLGSIARDSDGNLWYAYGPNAWRKLAGSATAGSFHPINPARVYDSRIAAYAPNNGPLARNTDRVISVKDGRDSAGMVTTADAVPAGATAVSINVTVTGPTGPNYLSVVPGDAGSFTASTINWPGGFDCANGTIVKLDGSRQLKVFCGDQAGSTHFIIDVTGYYL